VEVALAAYNTRYEEFKKRSLKETTEELLKNANNELFNALQKEECINKNFTTLYGENIPAHILLLKTNYEALIRKRIELQQLVNSEYNQFTYDELQKFNNQLIDLYTKLSSGYADICSKVPELCNCK
jgi:Txe/YoeB family toxin of Txe-Axe toxin-antitoxin module